MSECKVKINVDICGESALDTVTKLVVGYTDDKGVTCNPIPLKTACKQVAEDFNKTNNGAAVKWQTLRQAYYRANNGVTCNPSDEKLVHVPTKKLVLLDVPIIDNSTIIDTTIYITRKEHQAILEKTIADYEGVIASLTSDLKKVDPAPDKKISREKAYNFIQKTGNQFQCLALKKDGLSNEDLLKIFFVVRETYKNTTPPPSWDKEIIEAEKITN